MMPNVWRIEWIRFYLNICETHSTDTSRLMCVWHELKWGIQPKKTCQHSSCVAIHPLHFLKSTAAWQLVTCSTCESWNACGNSNSNRPSNMTTVGLFVGSPKQSIDDSKRNSYIHQVSPTKMGFERIPCGWAHPLGTSSHLMRYGSYTTPSGINAEAVLGCGWWRNPMRLGFHFVAKFHVFKLEPPCLWKESWKNLIFRCSMYGIFSYL